MIIIFLDPVTLSAEGQYNLNSFKEYLITDSFLEFNKRNNFCQDVETIDDCRTREFIENLRQKCGCIPFSISSIDFNVKTIS